jgi:arylsulfatase A-like enzyme
MCHRIIFLKPQLKYVALKLMMVVIGLLFFSQSFSQAKPNVLIIFIDDLGYGDLSCYGNKEVQTINIDALAHRGTRFTQFYSNAPVCSPSRVAMMTGQYPARHGFCTYLADRKKNRENKMPDYLPDTVFTLARLMQRAGYATAHFGKWHLGGGRDVDDAPLPTDYGFDKSFTSFEGLGDRTLTMADNLNKQSAALGRGSITEAPQKLQTAMYVDSALAFISSTGGKPFFVNLFPNDVHDPFYPEEGSEKEFANVTSNIYQQKFLATLKAMDQQIGRLMNGLQKMGKLENTLVLFSSDNGPTDWPFYYKDGGVPPGSAGNLRGRKWSLYEGGIRAPFIAVWPGKIPAGVVNKQAVMSIVDILPTMASLTGMSSLPKQYIPDGYDESTVLTRQTTQGKQKELFWYYNNIPVPGKTENVSPLLAIRWRDWKFLMNPDGSQQQLFNLRTDHREQRNVSTKQQKIAAQLSKKLKNWYQQIVVANLKAE